MSNNFFEKEYSYTEIFKNLENESTDDFIKIFSILNIEKILNQKDSDCLMFHLTNHSTPIREICAMKLEEISKTQSEFFLNDYAAKQILKGIVDINPNISRAICSIIENCPKIQALIIEDLIKMIFSSINDIKKGFCDKNKNKKSHAKNKKTFALYWYLEALSCCENIKNNSKVLEIVNFAITFSDYTIREKGVKLLTKIPDVPSELLQKAKYDQNFYVKNLLYGKIDYDE